MNARKWILGFVVSALLASTPGLAHDRSGDRRSGMLERWSERLELSSEQREKLRAALERRGNRFKEIQERRRDEFSQLWQKDSASAKDFGKAFERRERGDKMRQVRAEFLAEVHAMLNPEQRGKAAKLMQERRMGHGHGKSGHRWHRGKRGCGGKKERHRRRHE